MAKQIDPVKLSTAKPILATASENAGGFCFNTKNDAIRFANEIAQSGRRRASKGGLSFAKDYADGVVNIHIEMTSGTDSRIFKLVSDVVPLIYPEDARSLDIKIFVADKCGVTTTKRKANHSDMLVVGDPAPLSDYVIPAVIGFGGSNKIQQIGINPLASAYDRFLKVCSILSDREVDFFSVFAPELDGGVTNCLIKSMPSPGQNGSRFSPEVGRWPAIEAEQDNLFAGLVVALSDDLIVAGFAKGCASGFEVSQIFPSFCDSC